MQALIDHGRNIGFTALKSGDFAPLRSIVADTLADDSRKSAAATAALFGALHFFGQVLDSAKAVGVRFAVEPVDCSRLAYAAMSDLAEYDDLSVRIINDIVALRRDAPNLSIDWPSPAAEQINPEPIAVRVVEQPDSGPTEVRVVAMPPRHTETAIERDKAGNIVATKQVEVDASG